MKHAGDGALGGAAYFVVDDVDALFEETTHGFIGDRAANKDDVIAGHAAVSCEEEVGARPIPNAVPQYAFHVDRAGKRTPGFVIQAEQAGTLRIIGFKPLSDEKLIAALENEFEFLGRRLRDGVVHEHR